MRGPVLVRSVGFRFGAIYAALFGLSAVALAMFLWWSTAGLLDRQTDAAIESDSNALDDRYREQGLLGLFRAIEERQAGNIDDDAIYLLVNPDLERLAGNLEHWPHRVPLDTGWFELPVERAGLVSMARVHEYSIPGGYHLLVGRDVQVRSQMARILRDGLLWAAVLTLGLAVVGAFALRSLLRMTLSDVSATAEAISAGDLGRRVRVTGRGDEFDRLAETINDMLDRIGRLMDGVRQVSNAIAHDLRTPIARARARLEDAARPEATEADLRSALERAQSDLDGVTRVFQALLRIAEIEAGARRSAFGVIDLAPLLRDLAELYEAAAEDRGQVLRLRIADRLTVFGDREMIQQALVNLLDNALKFSPSGGTVSLSAETATDGVRIAVADQGPGIPDGDRSRATERFFRGEAARHTQGSGLGLALVQAVAGLHGGSLRLEDNAPGLRAVLMLAAAMPSEPSLREPSLREVERVSPRPQPAVTAPLA